MDKRTRWGGLTWWTRGPVGGSRLMDKRTSWGVSLDGQEDLLRGLLMA